MNRKIKEIAYDIAKDWSNVNYAALPYLTALMTVNSINDNYHFDNARSLINYFLSNAASYRTKQAKVYKNELRQILKG